MEDNDESNDNLIQLKMSEPQQKRKPKKIIIPKREKSVEIPQPRILVMTAGIKPKPIKLRQCLQSPLTLYELCAEVLDRSPDPDPFQWNEEQVADWMEEVVGLPRYRECITDNRINGRRLLRLEDPSVLPEINIHDFTHIKKITSEVRKLFATDYITFARNMNLPFRKPSTYCKWFKSRTGPNWGIRQNWTRSDIFRWMKIIMPKPLHLDHWDLVWYQKPDCPKVMIARTKIYRPDQSRIPKYEPSEEYCNEYLVLRKFRLQGNIPEDDQFIWMEHLPGSPFRKEPKKEKAKEEGQKKKEDRVMRLMPKKVILTGLAGKDLILARRKMNKPKFLA